MATHSCVLAWRIPGTGEPGGLQCLGSHRVGHDWSDLAAAAAAAAGHLSSLCLSCRICKKGAERDIQFSSVQLLSHVQLFATPWITARQASLSIINSWSLLKLMSVESVMPSRHLILCRLLLLLPPIPPSLSLFQWVNSSQEVTKELEFQL